MVTQPNDVDDPAAAGAAWARAGVVLVAVALVAIAAALVTLAVRGQLGGF